ncbi:MAG: septum formation initiator family protein [candidate division KSB1 bacterium]|nr:septum formation initiator family protein [candidate division KSB1 bacterium]
MGTFLRASGRRGQTGRWLRFALVVLLLYIFIFGDYGVYNYFRLVRLRNRIVREIDQLRREKEELAADIERLSTDRAYLEKLAREKYHLGKPGEKIYVLRKKK